MVFQLDNGKNIKVNHIYSEWFWYILYFLYYSYNIWRAYASGMENTYKIIDRTKKKYIYDAVKTNWIRVNNTSLI